MSTRHFPVIGLLSCICFCGCDSSPQSDTGSGGPSITVVYEDQPLADVQVRLHEAAQGPVLAQAITSDEGRAVFRDLQSPEPSEYFVSMDSLSDGGWILNPKVVKPALDAIRVQPFATNTNQQIELPSRSIQSLQPNTKR